MAKKQVYAVVRLPGDTSQYKKKWLAVQIKGKPEEFKPDVSKHVEFDQNGLFTVREDDEHVKQLTKVIATICLTENTATQKRIVGPFEDKDDGKGNVDSAEQQALRAARDAAPLTTEAKLEKVSAEKSALESKLAQLQADLAAKK